MDDINVLIAIPDGKIVVSPGESFKDKHGVTTFSSFPSAPLPAFKILVVFSFSCRKRRLPARRKKKGRKLRSRRKRKRRKRKRLRSRRKRTRKRKSATVRRSARKKKSKRKRTKKRRRSRVRTSPAEALSFKR